MSRRPLRALARAPIVPAQVGAAALAAADYLWVARPGDLGWTAWGRGLLLALALAAPIGLLAAAVACAATAAWPGLRRPGLGAVIGAPAAAALWTAGFAAALLFAAFRLHAPGLSAWAVAIASLLFLPLALWPALAIRRALAPVAARFPRAGGWLAVAALAAGGAILAPRIRPLGLTLGALAAGFVAAAALRRPLPRAGAVIAAAGLALALSPLCDDPVAGVAARRGVLLPAVSRVLSPLLDFDGDGALGVLGGGDCDGGDPAISPRGIDTPGDGVDQDCRFGDRVAPPPAPRPGAPRAARVFLLSVSDLDIDEKGTLHPPLPALQRAIDRGVRFAGAVGIAGRFRDVAPVLIDGALPPSFAGLHGGFATAIDSIPAQLERDSGLAWLSGPRRLDLRSFTTQFRRHRTKVRGRRAAQVIARIMPALVEPRSFAWAHIDLGGAAADRAAADLVAKVEKTGGRILVVGLPRRWRGDGLEVPGGPLAMVGAGIEPRIETAPVGLYDVYPTLAAELGLEVRGVPAGADLLHLPERPGALGGVVARVASIGARGAAGWVRHRPLARVFESSAGRFGESDAGPEAVAPLAALVRDRVLAPRLAAQNRALAAALDARLPADLDGTPTVIAGALTLYGCTFEALPSNHMHITLYMSGGEQLRPEDLIAFKVSSAHHGSMHGHVAPVDGAYPFGSWRHGELVANALDVDLRPLHPGTATVWIGVQRGRHLLKVTSGSGSTPVWGRVCNVEVP